MLVYSSSGVQSTKAGKAWREEQKAGWSHCIQTQKAEGEIGSSGRLEYLKAFSKWPASSTVSLPPPGSTFPNQLRMKASSV